MADFWTVYYLWTAEALQDAREEGPGLSETMPAEYARGAIEAAAALVTDPNHAAWVKIHWGDDYLHSQNIFYRMLYISALTNYQKLLGDDRYQGLLLEQVNSLSNELDASPYGLLDDYPGQCYPVDILPAIAAIQRADEALGTDHSASIARTSRAFEGSRLDPLTGLPAYVADSKTGIGIGPSRGVGVSYMLIWMPELWPEKAKEWYTRYDDFFWRENWLVAGIREFPEERSFPDWNFADVDAGPVLAGFGTAASAFGLGAARANGRLDQAYPLSGEALVASWPLADGTLLGPRLLSNLSDAPYLGESALLLNFTRMPAQQVNRPHKRIFPAAVYVGNLLFAVFGALLVGLGVLSVRRWRKTRSNLSHFPLPGLQFFVWVGLIISALTLLIVSDSAGAAVFILLAQFLPRRDRKTSGLPTA